MSLSNPINPPVVNEAVAQPVSTGKVFGVDENQTKVNQLHGITFNNVIGAGIPKQVSNVQVSIANAATGSTCTVSILYKADPTDSSLSGVNIWVKGYQGNSNPVQVGSGTSSPTKIVLNNTGETVTFIIQAFGNGGNAPFTQSPTCSGTLPKSTNGGFGSSSVPFVASVPSTSNATAIQGIGVDSVTPLEGDVLRYSAQTGKYEPVLCSDWVIQPMTGSATPGLVFTRYIWAPTSPSISGTGTQTEIQGTSTEVYGSKYDTTTTASTTAGWSTTSASNFLPFGNIRRVRFRIQLNQTTAMRIWVGWASATGNTFAFFGNDTLPASIGGFVGFRYSTNAGDTKWQIVTHTGTPTQTTTATTIAPDTNIHDFDFVWDGTQVKFYIDRVLVGTISTTLSLTAIGGPCMIIDNLTGAVSKTVTFYYAAGTIDYTKL